VEVKIGVVETPRELVLTSSQTPDEVQAQVTEALQDGSGTLTLDDEKGRRVLVPSAKIAYVEIGPADSRRVGFSVTS
jgi:hypothetical protein